MQPPPVIPLTIITQRMRGAYITRDKDEELINTQIRLLKEFRPFVKSLLPEECRQCEECKARKKLEQEKKFQEILAKVEVEKQIKSKKCPPVLPGIGNNRSTSAGRERKINRDSRLNPRLVLHKPASSPDPMAPHDLKSDVRHQEPTKKHRPKLQFHKKTNVVKRKPSVRNAEPVTKVNISPISKENHNVAPRESSEKKSDAHGPQYSKDENDEIEKNESVVVEKSGSVSTEKIRFLEVNSNTHDDSELGAFDKTEPAAQESSKSVALVTGDSEPIGAPTVDSIIKKSCSADSIPIETATAEFEPTESASVESIRAEPFISNSALTELTTNECDPTEFVTVDSIPTTESATADITLTKTATADITPTETATAEMAPIESTSIDITPIKSATDDFAPTETVTGDSTQHDSTTDLAATEVTATDVSSAEFDPDVSAIAGVSATTCDSVEEELVLQKPRTPVKAGSITEAKEMAHESEQAIPD